MFSPAGMGREQEGFLELLGRRDMVDVTLVVADWYQEENMSGSWNGALGGVVCVLLAGRSAVVGVWLGSLGWSQEEIMSGRCKGALGRAVCVLLVGRSVLVGTWL